MRMIERTVRFKKDYKREMSGMHRITLSEHLLTVVKLLAEDAFLPKRYYDHALLGKWKDCRDCHIKPDLVLIYRKPNNTTLELVRLGSHSELGLERLLT